jgi:hypothetical protein
MSILFNEKQIKVIDKSQNISLLFSFSNDLLIDIISYVIDIKLICTLQLINKELSNILCSNDELYLCILREFFKPLVSIKFGNVSRDERSITPYNLIKLLISRGKKTFAKQLRGILQGKRIVYYFKKII